MVKVPLLKGGIRMLKVPLFKGGQEMVKVPLAFGGCEGDRASAINEISSGFQT